MKDYLNYKGLETFWQELKKYLSDKFADKSTTYTKTEVDSMLDNVSVDLSDYYTKSEVDNKFGSITITTIGAKGRKTITLATQQTSSGGMGMQDSYLAAGSIDNGILTLSGRELTNGYLVL